MLAFEGRVLVKVEQAITVKKGKCQAETPQHFYQPLMYQRIRNKHQDAICPARGQLLGDNQARFDGFAQAYLVGQEHTGCNSGSHLRRDVYLMG